jgi:hypothetical protein
MKSPYPTLKVPLFGGTIVLTRTIDEWDAACRKFGAEPFTPRNVSGLTTNYRDRHGERHYICGVFDSSIGTLAHEVAHAVFFIFGDVGATVEAGQANEAFTYMLGHLMTGFLATFGSSPPGE